MQPKFHEVAPAPSDAVLHERVLVTTAPTAPPRTTTSRTTTSRTTTRRVFAGERLWLGALDLAVVFAVSFAAGSTGAASAVRAVATVLAIAVAGLYAPRLTYSVFDDLPRAALGAGVALPLGLFLPLPTLVVPHAFGALPVAWPAALLAAVLAGRTLGYAVLRRRRRRFGGEATIVIGTGDVAVRVAETLAANRNYGLAPVGLVGPEPVTEPSLPVPLLGGVNDLSAVVAEHMPRHVVVAFPGASDADLVGPLRQWRSQGIRVYLVPRLFELAVGRTGAELVSGIPLVRMRPEPPLPWRRAVKRAIDIVGAAFGLVVLAPVLAACALAVRWESGKAKVLFRQIRIGKDGREFTILKFRSLTPATQSESEQRWNINTDARVGKVGRILRNTSLDELPQLLNVLRGDMSLVGPRPERPFFVDQFTRHYTGYADRHRVAVGLTGWAQVNGLRGDTSIEERVRFDNFYIENWSLAFDLKILFCTVAQTVGLRRG